MSIKLSFSFFFALKVLGGGGGGGVEFVLSIELGIHSVFTS